MLRSMRGTGMLVLAGLLGIAGCTTPMPRGGIWTESRTIQIQPGPEAAPEIAPPPGEVATASRAESACVATGREQGLTVHRVVGTRETRDSDGMVTGRDVMLQVSRTGQMYEVRCNYSAQSDTARIMSL